MYRVERDLILAFGFSNVWNVIFGYSYYSELGFLKRKFSLFGRLCQFTFTRTVVESNNP